MDYGSNMYSTTSYGGQGGGNGGGFMAEAQGSQGEGKSRFTKDSLRPVTLKQITAATQAHPDSDFTIDGQEVSQIAFVGQVRDASTATTFNTYRLDDGTAEMEVRLWLNSETVDDAMDDAYDVLGGGAGGGAGAAAAAAVKRPFADIQPNGYVKGFGRINSYGNRITITATTLRPVKDINEYHLHFLEATAVHLYFTRGPPPSKLRQQAQHGAKGGADGELSGSTTAAGQALPPMSPAARKVYTLLSNSPDTNEGLHVQTIAASLSMPLTEVCKACDELTSGSLIFSTIDEETFAVL
ncbi:replication factor A protein 2 [Ascosphaera acerosa]|nr:replication factor A protein 2 [Ascosphaera acerosa]